MREVGQRGSWTGNSLQSVVLMSLKSVVGVWKTWMSTDRGFHGTNAAQCYQKDCILAVGLQGQLTQGSVERLELEGGPIFHTCHLVKWSA